MLFLHFRQILVFFPSLVITNPTLTPLLHLEQKNKTLAASIGALYRTTCPFSPIFFGLTFLAIIFIPSTTILSSLENTCSTFPFFPRSLPVIIFTMSFFLIFIISKAPLGLMKLFLQNLYYVILLQLDQKYAFLLFLWFLD